MPNVCSQFVALGAILCGPFCKFGAVMCCNGVASGLVSKKSRLGVLAPLDAC